MVFLFIQNLEYPFNKQLEKEEKVKIIFKIKKLQINKYIKNRKVKLIRYKQIINDKNDLIQI